MSKGPPSVSFLEFSYESVETGQSVRPAANSKIKYHPSFARQRSDIQGRLRFQWVVTRQVFTANVYGKIIIIALPHVYFGTISTQNRTHLVKHTV
jgi:hypothetical protein